MTLPRTIDWIFGIGLLTGGLLVGCERRVELAPRPTIPVPSPKKPIAEPPPPAPKRGLHPAAQSPQLARIETTIQQQINQIRREQGLPPLKSTPALEKLARAYSRQMAQENFFSHETPSGESLTDRVETANLRYQYVGENIFKAVNVPPDQVATLAVQSWMQSTGHRQNILRPQFNETGVGVWKQGRDVYITQEFMRPR